MTDDLRQQYETAIRAHCPMGLTLGGVLDAVMGVRDDELDALRYERRLLGAARLVLDLVAAGDPSRWEQARREAEDIAQRIVDEIGRVAIDRVRTLAQTWADLAQPDDGGDAIPEIKADVSTVELAETRRTAAQAPALAVGIADHLRDLGAAQAEVARLRAGESEQQPEEGAELTPAQWIRRWNDATPERRLAWAARVLELSRAEAQCFASDHEGRIAEAEQELARLRQLVGLLRDAADEFHDNPQIALTVVREWLDGAREVVL